MVRGWLKIIAVLSLGFMMPILLIRAQPYNDDGLRRFLNAGEDCVPPCLMNVLPGTTPLYKAHLDLLAHEWIASVESNEYALLGEPTSIRWAWNGQQPAFFPSTGRGSVFSRDGIIVDEVQVEAGLPLGGWWLALGPPDTYRLTTIGGTIHFPGEYLAFINIYHDPEFAILGIIECPYRASLWQTQVALRVRLEQTFPEPNLATDASLPRRVAELERLMC